MKIARNFGLAMALSSLAVAGAAQAATRSSEAVPGYTPVAAQTIARGSAESAVEQDLRGRRGSSVILFILAAAAVIAALIIAFGNGDDDPLSA